MRAIVDLLPPTALKKSDFHYDLPAELIAQAPLAERSASRLLLVPPAPDAFTDLQVRDLPSLLQPGDLLLSGTPAISRTVYPGDVVEVEVEGLGTLRNHIVTGPTPIRTDVGAQVTESEEVLSTAQGGDWEFRGIRKPMPPQP